MPHRPHTLRRFLYDRLGIGASVICLVHCLALPFVLTGAAAWGARSHEAFHVGVALVSIPLALVAAWPGYREHRDRLVPVLLLGGAVLFGASVAAHDALGEAGALLVSLAGSVLLLSGHLRNYRRRALCAAHAIPHHRAHHDAH